MENCEFTTIGFVGAGNMAQAIGLRLIEAGRAPNTMMISAPSDRNLKIWKDKGVLTTHKNVEVSKFADLLIVAVKPQFFEIVAAELKGSSLKCVVSIMAGISLSKIKKALGLSESSPVFRVMPNTPTQIGFGCSVICRSTYEEPDKNLAEVKKQVFEGVKNIINVTGSCTEIPEVMFNSATAVCGSSPAFVYMIIEAMADGGVKRGIPRNIAIKLAAETVLGASKMVLETGKHPGLLKDEVCSPGGMTIVGVSELENSGIRSAFINAIVKTAEKGDSFNN